LEKPDTENLRGQALSGSIWSITETFITQIIQFAIGVILARLLGPKEYGLIALTGIFTAISAAITDAGFEKTLIQRRTLNESQISTIFYINVFIGAIVTSVIFISAPAISRFFNEPELTAVLRVVSFGILITSLGQTQQALLIKDLKLKIISLARIISSIVSGVIGLVLAYKGFGVWALVFSGLGYQVMFVSFFWLKSGWHPKLVFSINAVKPLIPNGLNILGSSIFFFTNQQFNNFVIGKYFNKTELGLFTRGVRFPELVINTIQNVVMKMSLPLFSKLQDQQQRLADTVSKVNRLITFICFPILTLLLIKAEDITIFLFTEKWRGSIIFLQLFCLIKLFEPYISVQRELLLSKGKARLLLKIFFFTSILEMVLIVLAARLGIAYIALSMFISRLFQYIIYYFIFSRDNKISLSGKIRESVPYYLITLLMAAVVIIMDFILTNTGVNLSLFFRISSELIIGILSYSILSYIFKIEEVELFQYALKMGRKYLLN
jgi:teichuronic acid exporter